MSIAKSLPIPADGGSSDPQELRSTDVAEMVKASKSWSKNFDLLNNSISDIVDPAITENVSESLENIDEYSPCSKLNLDDEPFLHSHHSAEKEVGTSHSLKENLSCWECDILLSPCDDLRFKDFVSRPSHQIKQMSCLESTADDGREMAESYCETQQQVDWVNELECLEKMNMHSLSMLLLESEDDWEERSNKDLDLS
ncbi:hypothetical protein KI387_030755, partial [Taxus chinensis]